MRKYNVYSPAYYTLEKFMEIQHVYLLMRKRLENRKSNRLDDNRSIILTNEKIIERDRVENDKIKELNKNISQNKDILEHDLFQEMLRINFEKDYLERLFFLGKRIRKMTLGFKNIKKIAIDSYDLHLKIYQDSIEKKDIFSKAERENNLKNNI